MGAVYKSSYEPVAPNEAQMLLSLATAGGKAGLSNVIEYRRFYLFIFFKPILASFCFQSFAGLYTARRHV